MSEKSIKEQSNGSQIENMLASSGYSEKAIRYFMEKPNMGTIPDADQMSEMTGTRGDTMSVCIKIEKGAIKEVKYQVLGCPGAVASAMAAADLIKGKTVDEASKLNDGDVFLQKKLHSTRCKNATEGACRVHTETESLS